MKSFAAAIAFAAGVSATYPAGNVTYTTEVVTSYETYCPEPTTLTYGTNTYTVTEPTTVTITDCPCTVSTPIYTTSSIPSETPVYPTTPVSYPTEVPTSYANSTAPVPPTEAPTTVYPTGSMTPTSYPTSIPTAGAGKAAALSGAGLAGVMGLVAYIL